MLFILSTPNTEKFKMALDLAGENKKTLLLISDGVYLSRPAFFERLAAQDWDDIYADKKALTDRGLDPADGCIATDMADIVDLTLEHKKVIHL